MESSDTDPELTRVPLAVWGQAIIIVVGSFASMLSSTIVGPALPALGQRFGVDDSAVQWVTTVYLLALAAGVPVSGWLGRKLGTTRLWLLGLALFACFSVVCAVADSLPVLLIGRALQGLAGGLLVPTGQTILALITGRKFLGRVGGTVGIAVVVAPVLGTTLGSVMLEHLDVAWLFWLNVPLSVIAFIAGLRWLPRVATSPAGPLDVLGLVLAMSGMPVLLYGLSSFTSAGETTALLCIAGGAVLLLAFVIWQLRSRTPLMRIRLFGNAVFASGAAVMFFGGAVNFGAQVVLPLYFTQARGESMLTAGVLLAPQIIGTAIGFPLAGRLSDRYGAGTLVAIGALVTAIATVPLALSGTHTDYAVLSAVMLVRGFGVALSTMPAMTAGLSAVDRTEVPDAAPILNMLQRFGASAGTAVIAALYAGHLQEPMTPQHAANAFGFVSWWLFAATVALGSLALLLARAERAARDRNNVLVS
ncbi:DHA2 family efflux MFS transporter permease subunit [Plantibacter sp. Mn2098]|uniref:DHA2 family efflux MFS transporter permease subunit n=1 Tax=Plantibacter sp. Mn2098 TaxID=3395266 RepID=UPI003BE71B18